MIWRIASLLLWTFLVLGFSSDTFSSDSTSRILLPLLRWLFPTADASLLAALHYAIRKLAHVAEFAALGALALHAIRGLRRHARSGSREIALAMVWSLAVATTDELHQGMTTRRSGAAADVALDLSGSAAAVALYALAQRRSSALGGDSGPGGSKTARG
jgi:VanZ family protein